MLFEWLYKNESLKALGEAGYFDNPLNENNFDELDDDIYDKRNGKNPDYFELEANFCDDLNKVTLSIFKKLRSLNNELKFSNIHKDQMIKWII